MCPPQCLHSQTKFFMEQPYSCSNSDFKERKNRKIVIVVSWRFEPSQPYRVISGLEEEEEEDGRGGGGAGGGEEEEEGGGGGERELSLIHI